jgi:glycosyltransferase involved in cell wall biosynthesis
MSLDRDRLLFVARWPPVPANSGWSIRSQRLLTGLARHFDTTFVTYATTEGGEDRVTDAAELEGALPGVEVVTVPAPAYGSKRLAQALSLTRRPSWEFGRYGTPEFGATLAGLVAQRGAAIVHFDDVGTLQVAPVPGAANAYSAHNIEHRIVRGIAQATSGPRSVFADVEARKLAREERRGWLAVDVATAPSEIEADFMRRAGARRVEVCPNGTDERPPLPLRERPAEDPVRIVFVGNGTYRPYETGLAWFASEVLPRLRGTLPVAFEAVGRSPHRPVEAPEARYVGVVDDVVPHYERADLVVVPVFEGGGTRLKIVEAAALGRPVVSTTLGAEGLPVEPGRDYWRADDPDAFAAAVVEVARTERARLQERLAEARRAIEPLFWPKITDALAGHYREAIAARS